MTKPLAPHVQAAISAAAQPKRAADPARPVAAHVQRAVAASAQPKAAPGPPQQRPPAAPAHRPTPPTHPPLATRPVAEPPLPPAHPAVQMSKRQRTWDLEEPDKKKKRKVTVEGASGHTGSGYKLVGRKLKPRRTKNRYKGRRVEQVLGQISTLTYFNLKQDEKVTEVEALWASGCLFLSCNLASATQALYDKLALTESDDLWKEVVRRTGKSNTKTGKITGRMADKIRKVREGQRDIGKEGKDVIFVFGKKDLAWVDLSDEDCGFYVGGMLEVGGFTVVVFGQDKRHAEVKLVKALESAGYKGSATVQGKKRPCYTCAAYMRLRKKEGLNLTFSDNPGKLWKDEYDRSELDVKKEVIRSIQEEREMNVSYSGEQYRSDSESDSED